MHLRFPTSLISFRNYKHNDNYTMLKLSYSIKGNLILQLILKWVKLYYNYNYVIISKYMRFDETQ